MDSKTKKALKQAEANAQAGKMAIISTRDISDETIGLIQRFPELKIRDPVTRDEQLQLIAQLPNLHELTISGPDITEQGLNHLKGMEKLEALLLGDLAFENLPLSFLSSLERLKELHLWGHQRSVLRQDVFKVLQHHPSLQALHLKDITVSDECLRSLKGCPHLNYITLLCHGVTCKGISYLQQVENLEKLVICSFQDLIDEDMASIADMKKLRALVLVGVKITDEGMKHLRKLKRLERLMLSHTDVSAEAMKNLEQYFLARHFRRIEVEDQHSQSNWAYLLDKM